MPSDERIREIVSNFNAQRRAHEAEYQKRVAAEAIEEEFRAAWNTAYGPLSPFPDRDETGAVQEAAAQLLIVGRGMRERFWDFYVSALFLELTAFPYPSGVYMHYPRYIVEPCFRILGHACLDRGNVLEGVIHDVRDFIPSIQNLHHDMFSILFNKGVDGLPFTPPLTRDELVELTGSKSKEKLRMDERRGKWEVKNAVRFGRLRQFRHCDRAVQAGVLEKIRETHPEKMWSDLV